MFLLKYWKLLASAGAGVALTALVSWTLHTLDVKRIEANNLKAIENVTVQLQEQCAKDKALTSEVSNGYQVKIASLNRELARLKRLRDPVCIPVITGPASGRDASTTGGELSNPHGIMDNALLDFAAEAEQYRLQLISCQDFIRKTWEAR